MTDRLSDLWRRQNDDADFSKPGACATRCQTLAGEISPK